MHVLIAEFIFPRSLCLTPSLMYVYLLKLSPVYMEKRHPSPLPRANRGEPSFPTIAYKSSSTVYMRNCKPGLGDRVTLGGKPTFSHVNGFKWVNWPSWAKLCHTEHVQADISVPWEGQLIITRLMFFLYRRVVKLAQGEGAPGPWANYSLCLTFTNSFVYSYKFYFRSRMNFVNESRFHFIFYFGDELWPIWII